MLRIGGKDSPTPRRACNAVANRLTRPWPTYLRSQPGRKSQRAASSAAAWVCSNSQLGSFGGLPAGRPYDGPGRGALIRWRITRRFDRSQHPDAWLNRRWRACAGAAVLSLAQQYRYSGTNARTDFARRNRGGARRPLEKFGELRPTCSKAHAARAFAPPINRRSSQDGRQERKDTPSAAPAAASHGRDAERRRRRIPMRDEQHDGSISRAHRHAFTRWNRRTSSAGTRSYLKGLLRPFKG